MDYNKEIKDAIIKKDKEGKYSIFSSDAFKKYINSDSIDIIFDIVREWDEGCNLSTELGEALNNISRDENNMIAFSRVYLAALDKETNIIKSDEIADIAKYGLENNGHVNSSAAIQKVIHPSLKLSPFVGIEGWIQLIGSYKNNNAIILYSLPKQYVDEDCHFTSPNADKIIYNYSENGIPLIKPEYLIGMIVKNKDNAIDVFLTRDDMLGLENNKTR